MITPTSMTWNTSNGDLDHRDVSDESLRIPCAEVAPRSLLHPMGGDLYTCRHRTLSRVRKRHMINVWTPTCRSSPRRRATTRRYYARLRRCGTSARACRRADGSYVL